MQEFNIGSLTIMSGGVPAPGFTLSIPIEGLDGPKHRTSSYSKPGRHGVEVSAQFYDERLVTFTGLIYGESLEEFEANRRALITAVAIKKDDDGYPEPTRVSFTTLAGDSYIVDIYFDKPLMNMESPIHATYQVTGVCADPFIFGASTVTSAQIRPPSGGGYAVPMIVPYISDASVGGSITLTNDGTETAMPVITLTGLLTQPVLSNQTTGKRLELNYVLPEGEPLTIDMENQLIIRSGASQIGAKTIASDWWGLAPGPNAISLTTMSSSDTGYALLTFNPPYMGV
ncbi:hypothetical protein BJF87_21490 [Gordonia sp. CNJ-863]|nr:hypothetical protein BJF87_21490 [Gordonia sp. CNJ-863]